MSPRSAQETAKDQGAEVVVILVLLLMIFPALHITLGEGLRGLGEWECLLHRGKGRNRVGLGLGKGLVVEAGSF